MPKPTATQDNVSYMRDDVSRMIFLYNVIHDCIDGEPAIKGVLRPGGINNFGISGLSGGAPVNYDRNTQANLTMNTGYAKRYLPQPNPEDNSPENSARYRTYLERAVFYNVTGRTLDGMAGQVFQRDPVVELPKELEGMELDADGTGVGLTQLAMRTLRVVLPYGRGGLFCDYPPTSGATSKKQLQDGYIQPVISFYAPWDIVNWRTKKRGAKQVLSLIVLREVVNISDDDFEYIAGTQYRILRLDDNNVYFQEIYSENEVSRKGAKKSYSLNETIQVKDSKGKSLDYIPFTFVGAENNDTTVDMPPFFDLATLNIAHYRNSADYEESSFITGQPTIFLSGLTEDWVKNILKGAVAFGARSAVPLPVNASADLIQADPNTLPGEAMEKKERQMVALGAKLVQQAMVQRTATESIMETSSETSILSNVAVNVSTAFAWALKIAASFAGGDAASIKFELNRQFELAQMTPDDQSKVIAGWQKGAYTYAEMRSALKKAGIATLPDDEAFATTKKEIGQLMSMGLLPDESISATTTLNDGAAPPPAPNPNTDPKKHALKKKTRGAGA